VCLAAGSQTINDPEVNYLSFVNYLYFRRFGYSCSSDRESISLVPQLSISPYCTLFHLLLRLPFFTFHSHSHLILAKGFEVQYESVYFKKTEAVILEHSGFVVTEIENASGMSKSACSLQELFCLC
jgi:hypothetical protein